jgi:hypothetical protein
MGFKNWNFSEIFETKQTKIDRWSKVFRDEMFWMVKEIIFKD